MVNIFNIHIYYYKLKYIYKRNDIIKRNVIIKIMLFNLFNIKCK